MRQHMQTQMVYIRGFVSAEPGDIFGVGTVIFWAGSAKVAGTLGSGRVCSSRRARGSLVEEALIVQGGRP